MFDSDEIAKKALVYAQEMRAEKKEKKRRLRWSVTVALLCVFIATIAAVVTINAIRSEESIKHIDYKEIPLAESPLPEENARP